MTLGYDERLRKQTMLAAAVTCATALFGLAFGHAMNFGVLPLFLVPVMICAEVGRTRAGLIATAISVPVAAYIFVPPAWSFDLAPDGIMRLALFAADAVLISCFFGAKQKEVVSS
jgi:K+-sensing histidine kinase KdpD